MSNLPDRFANLPPLKRAVLALKETQERLAAFEQARNEPIAIVGVGCRLPGGVQTPNDFWQLLRDGRCAVGDVPSSRWDVDAWYDPDPNAVGRILTRRGAFLADVDQFDPQFFGISPREAQTLDPQQRLALEVTWEAFENAGMAPDKLTGSDTGVFVGVSGSDYGDLLSRVPASRVDVYHASGMAHSMVSGRLSYVLGLQGPSISIDTACSSSLVAVHLASQALRAGDCRTAIAGGVNLILAPRSSVIFSRSRMLSADGLCKTFDATADGFGRGEGCVLLVLKRYSDALAAGDRVLALVRGSAVNQDGPSSGLTAPNGPAQESVIRQALTRAGLTPGDVDYVEAHGTGTSLGDPIEVQALAGVFGPSRAEGDPLLVGSVKTNLGHVEAAAGVTGLLKLALALHHQQIPPHLHLTKLNPHVAWDEMPIAVPTALTDWARRGQARIGGVSSFGFSGTNAHVILEEAPAQASLASGSEPRFHVFTASAKSPEALRTLTARYADNLESENAGVSAADACYTANAGRAHFGHRFALVARSAADLKSGLCDFAAARDHVGICTGAVAADRRPRIAFLFTGQGAQYVGMGVRLYETQPVFRHALDQCGEILAGEFEQPLVSMVCGTNADPEVRALLDQTRYTQPALFAVEWALAELWRSWGARPSMVMGHSVGEYVAATVAGVFSLEDGLRLIAARARLMQALPAGGRMAAVFADEARVVRAIDASGSTASIAAVNGAAHTVVSGGAAEVQAVLDRLAVDGTTSKELTVSHAFHSSLMDPMLDEFERVVRDVPMSQPRIKLVSNLTGALASGAELTDAAYWRAHVRQAVRFSAGIETLAREGCEIFVEIGPRPHLTGMAARCLPDHDAAWLPSLRPGHDDCQTILGSVGQMYVRGVDLDWRELDRDAAGARIELPTYPFERHSCWIDGVEASAPAGGEVAAGSACHPLLGRRVRTATKECVFETVLDVAALPYLRDHVVHGVIVLPATAYLEMAIAAGRDHFGTSAPAIEQVTIHQALVLPDAGSRVVQLLIDPVADDRAAFRILSEKETDGHRAWVLHVSGTLRPTPAVAAELEPTGDAIARCREQVDVTRFYEALHARGLEFGASFHGVKSLTRRDGEAVALVSLDVPPGSTEPYCLHPALLDACIQALAAAESASLDDASDIYMPIALDRFEPTGVSADRLASIVSLDPIGASNSETRTAHVRVVDGEGRLVARIVGLHLKRVTAAVLRRNAGRSIEDWFYRVDWQPTDALSDDPIAESLMRPAQIARRLEPRLPELVRTHGADLYDRLGPALDSVSSVFIIHALRRLGAALHAGDHFAPEPLAQTLRVVPQHHRLFARLLEILAEDGILQRSGDEWSVVREPIAVDPAGVIDSLRREFDRDTVEIDLTARCGAQLAEALRGEADPLHLLFPGGDLEAASRVYDSTRVARMFGTLIRETLETAVGTLPPNRRLRVLEVGAGTGGTSAAVLDMFAKHHCEYVYTDQGQAFLLKAAARFAQYPFVRYQPLDIEREPVEQGFDAHRYDVIIASNVLHATRDLTQTIAHVKQLLAPSGLLLLSEATRPQRWYDLTFGLTPGWWRFDDTDRRSSYPLMSAVKWLDALQEAGFVSAEAMPDAASNHGWTQNSVVIARGPETVVRDAAAGTWVVLCDEGAIGDAVADRLELRGGIAMRVRRGVLARSGDGLQWTIDPSNAGDYHSLLRELDERGLPPCRGALHLWSLDHHAEDRLDSTDVMQRQTAGCRSALHLAQALVARSPMAPALWLATRGTQAVDPGPAATIVHAPMWGLAKAIALEHPDLRCTCIDLDVKTRAEDVEPFIAELLAATDEAQIALRHDKRFVARLVRARTASGPSRRDENAAVRLEITTAGTVDGLALRPSARRLPAANEVEIRIDAAGLNFRDVMNVLAMRNDPDPLGGECAGTITAVGADVRNLSVGDEVIAIAQGTFGTFVTTTSALVFRKPASLTAADAATLPLAFLTAEYALAEVGHMKAGERVLIHAAAGGVGLAAVQLAMRAGLEVFATAGSEDKRAYLRSLGVATVMDSRSLAFAGQVAAATNGEGVDLVLNALTGAAIEKSLLLLRAGGRFLEVGKAEVWNGSRAAAVNPLATYLPLDLSGTLVREPESIRPIVERLLKRFERRELHPLPKRVFDLERASDAFRHMARARHIGKVVITPRTTEASRTPVSFSSEGSYLITGGLSGLGLLVAEWMAGRGARHLALMGRSEPSELARQAMARMTATGVHVRIVRGDVASEPTVLAALHELRETMPPLRGVIHSAGVLDDGVLQQQDWDRFSRVMAAKVEGAWNLHTHTRHLPLDFFVMFSSISSLLGSAGQTNHSAANAFLDALAHHRHEQSLPALSINWGAWSEIGAAARRGADRRAGSRGIESFSPLEGLAAFEWLLRSSLAQVAVLPVSWPKFLSHLPMARQWPFFAGFESERGRSERPAPLSEAAVAAAVHADLLERLDAAAPAKRRPMLLAHVQESVVRVLGLDRSRPMDRTLPLSEMGMDSLMAVELRNILGTSVGRPLPATLLFDFPTVTAVADYLAEHVLAASNASAPIAQGPAADGLSVAERQDEGATSGDVLDRIDQLSDEDIDRLLAGAKGMGLN